MKQKHALREKAETRVLRGQGGCLLVVRSVLWCVQLMDNRQTTKLARRKTSQEEGSDKKPKTHSRPQRGGGFLWKLCLSGVSGWSGVISHDISRYIVILYPISCDITRYDISRYRMHIPNFGDWYRDIVSRRNISRYRTLIRGFGLVEIWFYLLVSDWFLDNFYVPSRRPSRLLIYSWPSVLFRRCWYSSDTAVCYGTALEGR